MTYKEIGASVKHTQFVLPHYSSILYPNLTASAARLFKTQTEAIEDRIATQTNASAVYVESYITHLTHYVRLI